MHNRQIRQCLRGVIDSSDEESIERKRTMDKFDSQISKMKPGPLSSKIAQINQIERNYSISGGGNLMSLPMPKVNLEFSWSPGKNLDPFVKQYLKALVPHRDLTPEWLDFALAPIKHNNKSKDGKLEKRSFSVQVPYATKNQIVVRKLEHPVARDLDLEEMCKQVGSYTLDKGCSLDDEMEWTFANNSDSTDELECEIVDIIKDLTNSTFINLNDDLFVKEESLFETPSRIEKKQEGSLVVDLTPKQKRVKCPTRML